MTTPSPARQAAEAYACETGYKPEAFDIKWAVAHDAFLAGAAWMNEQCAKACEKVASAWDDTMYPTVRSDVDRFADEVRALNAGTEP